MYNYIKQMNQTNYVLHITYNDNKYSIYIIIDFKYTFFFILVYNNFKKQRFLLLDLILRILF